MRKRLSISFTAYLLERAKADASLLRLIALEQSSSSAKRLADLVLHGDYTVLRDTSVWNPVPAIGVDMFGGLTPDLVIRSQRAQDAVKNRVIEVKDEAGELEHYHAPDSQLARYLFHLLVTTVHSSDVIR